MDKTYTRISTQKLTNNTVDTITFSSIPQTYTDLVLVAHVKGTAIAYPRFYMNGGGPLSRLWVSSYTSASGVSSDNYITGGVWWNTDNFAYTSITQVFSYSSAAMWKPIFTQNTNVPLAGNEFIVSTWRNTTVVTSLTFYSSNQAFASGSEFTLYGIKAA